MKNKILAAVISGIILISGSFGNLGIFAQEADAEKNLLSGADIEASSVVNDGFLPENAFDGDVETAWSSGRLAEPEEAGEKLVLEFEDEYQWIEAYLSEAVYVDKIVIYPRKDIGRTFPTAFIVEVSPTANESDYVIVAEEKDYTSDGVTPYVIELENTVLAKSIRFTGSEVFPEVEGEWVCYMQISEMEAYYTGKGGEYIAPEQTATPEKTATPERTETPERTQTAVRTETTVGTSVTPGAQNDGGTGGQNTTIIIVVAVIAAVIIVAGIITIILRRKNK